MRAMSIFSRVAAPCDVGGRSCLKLLAEGLGSTAAAASGNAVGASGSAAGADAAAAANVDLPPDAKANPLGDGGEKDAWGEGRGPPPRQQP